MQTRNVSVNIHINGKNISTDIAPYLKSITYNDVLEGEADTAEITLQDKARLFIADWFPQRGDTCKIEIVVRNWSGAGEDTLPLGTFEIDEIKNSFPPNVANIKLNSVPNNAQIRSVDKSESWESSTLRQIATDIAMRSGMILFYDARDNPVIARAEMREESMLTFLQRLCHKQGLALKVSDSQIIIFDEEKYEEQSPIMTLSYGDLTVKTFSATATLSKIYSECHVKYGDSKRADVIEATYKAPGRRKGMTLEVSQKVETREEAERLARKELRKKNKDEIKCSLTCIGNFAFCAGNVLELDSGYGFYAGRYIIEKATHKIGGGYECSLELRKCLDY